MNTAFNRLIRAMPDNTKFVLINVKLVYKLHFKKYRFIYIPETNCFAFPGAVSIVHTRRDEYCLAYIHHRIRFHHPGNFSNKSLPSYVGFFALETHHRKSSDHSCWNFLYLSSQLSAFCCLIVLRRGLDVGLGKGAC